MMYNRYIPGSDGIYRRQSITVQEVPKEEKTCTADNGACSATIQTPSPSCRQTRSKQDIGDLLLLCIVVLLLIDSEEEDILPILIAAAAFMFLQ